VPAPLITSDRSVAPGVRVAVVLAGTMALAGLIIAPPGALGGPGPTPVGTAGAHLARTRTVVLRGNRFHPRTVSIHRGSLVRWVWRDGSVPHNVVSHSFKSSRTQTRGSFSVRFTRRGTYDYVCTIHSGMVGKVVVR
jgi:plastocyanin